MTPKPEKRKINGSLIKKKNNFTRANLEGFFPPTLAGMHEVQVVKRGNVFR